VHINKDIKMNREKPIVLIPSVGEKAYAVAGSEFACLWKKVSGSKLTVRKATKKLPAGDIVLIGGNTVNPLAYELLKSGNVEKMKVRNGTDDYRILTLHEAGRRILLLAGGCGRSTIYAVYDFFRNVAGIEYFWDGDIIYHNPKMAICDIDIFERPRFEYRGLRYFAHRGLHRFQAEQWNFEDWKREIDWILKKRMNFCMLRTGIDDLFQRTFGLEYPPEDGPDPDREERSFNDRTSPWSLKYRGELRKKVLRYAFDRGLLHPADTGTITHWYSHTPSSFYKKFPDFPLLKQTSGYYEGVLGSQIWDIEDQRAWDAYWKLTETAINEFGVEQSRIFHTIGLAERSFGINSAENFRIKTHALNKIQQEIFQRYPDAQLMLASWDMWQQWKNSEVTEMLKEMNPEKVLMLDYTADDYDRKTYKEWKVYKKFPWVFGIFHAFANQNEIRNDYAMLEDRVNEAAADEKCKGFIFWPELSHSDTFMLEYLAENSWMPKDPSVNHAIKRFCATRYPKVLSSKMEKVWCDTLLITRNLHWHRDAEFLKKHGICRAGYSNVLDGGNAPKNKLIEFYNAELKRIDPDLKKGQTILNTLALLAGKNAENEMWKRDTIDIARSILGVAVTAEFCRITIAMDKWIKNNCDKSRVLKIAESIRFLIKMLGDILETSEDFSIYHSMLKLKKTAQINPHTEQTLKANSENSYCRTQMYELVRYIFEREIEVYLQWLEEKIAFDNHSSLKRPDSFSEMQNKFRDEFYAVPLEKMAPEKCNCSASEFAKALKLVSDALGGNDSCESPHFFSGIQDILKT